VVVDAIAVVVVTATVGSGGVDSLGGAVVSATGSVAAMGVFLDAHPVLATQATTVSAVIHPICPYILLIMDRMRGCVTSLDALTTTS